MENLTHPHKLVKIFSFRPMLKFQTKIQDTSKPAQTQTHFTAKNVVVKVKFQWQFSACSLVTHTCPFLQKIPLNVPFLLKNETHNEPHSPHVKVK